MVPTEDVQPRQFRILYAYGGSAAVGGTERRMAEVAAYLMGQGHRVVSVLQQSQLDPSLLTLVRGSSESVHVQRGWIRLARVCRSYQPDLIVALGLRPSLWTRVLKLTGVSCATMVIVRNGLDHGRGAGLHRLDRVTSRLVDVYLANSEAAADHLRRVVGIRPGAIHVLPSALGSEWAEPRQGERSDRVVAMVGNRRPEKNQLLGLRAFLEADVDARLRIYTDDGQLLREELALHSKAAAARVDIVQGHRMGPSDYDRITVLLHPSLAESAPRAVMEARARGCYVIASDVGDTALIVGSGGEVVRDGVVSSYVRALHHAFALPDPVRCLPPYAGAMSVEEYAHGLLEMISAPGCQGGRPPGS